MSSAEVSLRRARLPLVLAYPVLAIVAAVSHDSRFSLAALVLLLTAWLLPRLLKGAWRPWLIWLLTTAAILALAACGLADALLEAVPLLIILALSWWFGRTLTAAREPLVARFIRVLEGADRLRLPGVARYARQVTTFWSGLLALQALALAGLWIYGLSGRDPLPRWALIYQHMGGYALIGLAFAAEYLYRRWRLRHIDHAGLHAQALQMVQCWPQLLHEKDATS